MTDPIMGSLTLAGAVSLIASGLCALAIIADVSSGNSQKMWITNHDANRDADRVSHELPGELVAAAPRTEGEDVIAPRLP
jgi:hypothetical protein